ncbi:hypothetical protein [Nostoc sp. C110]|uniref:hypothetical protein n=1 Tax=Nostoc sp. C110 TaxID=3349876 RepID=UPI00370DB67E
MVKWQEELYSHPFTHGEFWAKMRSLNTIINADISGTKTNINLVYLEKRSFVGLVQRSRNPT